MSDLFCPKCDDKLNAWSIAEGICLKCGHEGKEPQWEYSGSINPSHQAHEVLEAGAKHMKDRAATYDTPSGERSISKTVSAFNSITGHSITPEQGWLFMMLLKAVRSQQGDFKMDNYEDGAAYFALMGEQASGDRG